MKTNILQFFRFLLSVFHVSLEILNGFICSERLQQNKGKGESSRNRKQQKLTEIAADRQAAGRWETRAAERVRDSWRNHLSSGNLLKCSNLLKLPSWVWGRRVLHEQGENWSQITNTHLFPQLGMPTAWMMKITTWQKNTKKKKKKLTELSVLKKEERSKVLFRWDFNSQCVITNPLD